MKKISIVLISIVLCLNLFGCQFTEETDNCTTSADSLEINTSICESADNTTSEKSGEPEFEIGYKLMNYPIHFTVQDLRNIDRMLPVYDWKGLTSVFEFFEALEPIYYQDGIPYYGAFNPEDLPEFYIIKVKSNGGERPMVSELTHERYSGDVYAYSFDYTFTNVEVLDVLYSINPGKSGENISKGDRIQVGQRYVEFDEELYITIAEQLPLLSGKEYIITVSTYHDYESDKDNTIMYASFPLEDYKGFPEYQQLLEPLDEIIKYSPHTRIPNYNNAIIPSQYDSLYKSIMVWYEEIK